MNTQTRSFEVTAPRHHRAGGFPQALCSIFLCVVLFFVLAGGSLAFAQQKAPPGTPAPAPALLSPSGIIVDAESGKVLWQKGDRVSRAPASLTKILTALVVLENADLNAKVTMSAEARAARGSRTYAEQGWTFTVQDLLYGLLLPSGNDAAIALAQAVSPDGSVQGFMKMVNRRAADLGATATHFTNPHGLDEPGHVSSARDMALITLTALRNKTFARIVAAKRHDVPWANGSSHPFFNHNKMLSMYPGTIGVKTGYTGTARHTLSSAVNRNGATLVSVTLGSPKQYIDSVALFDWAFANLSALRGEAVDGLRPPRAPAAPPALDAPGKDPIGELLRLVESLSGPGLNPPAAALPISFVALASFLSVVGVSLRNQRRVRREPALLGIPAMEVPASPEAPYVSG